MEIVKQELQNQKLYDFLQQSGGNGATIELIMRSLDQDELSISLNPQPFTSSNSTSTLTGIVTSSLSSSRVSSSNSGHHNNQNQNLGNIGNTLELDPNIVLQNFTSLENGDESSSSSGDRPHVCQLCQASYKTRTHLRRHMVIHLNNRPYPCSDCGKGFNRREHLTKHIEAVHSGTKYKCHFCNKEISRKDHLARHIKNMHPAYAGNLKDGVFPDPSILKVQLPCGQKQKAQLSFLTPGTSLGPTVSVVGQTIITPVSSASAKSSGSSNNCSNPKLIDKGKNQLTTITNIEQNGHDEGNDEPQHTQIILDSAAFQQLSQLAILPGSIVIPGQITTVSVANPIGNIGSSSSSTISTTSKITKLQTQNINQNGLLGLTNLSLTLGGQIREAPFANCGEKRMLQVFSCSECSATFTSEKDLTLHSRTHKPQNFRCPDCPRAYTRREKLTEHIRCFHQGQKFKCDYCGKELSRKDHVLRHVRSIHPEVLASRFTAEHQENIDGHLGDDRLNPSGSNLGSRSNSTTMNEMGVLLRSICQYCLKVFGTSYHLSRHIESCHNGDIRPYSCTSCSKQFKRKDHLTKHMKAHCPNQNANGRIKSGKKKMEAMSSGNSNQLQTENRKTKLKFQNSTGSSTEEDDGRKTGELDETEMKEAEDADFNLAMINSFIAENVNVVVEEEDLLLHSQHSSLDNSSEEMSSSEHSENLDNSTSSHSQMTTFPCGHCQKEFLERDQLLDHLQVHTNDESDQNQELRSIQFSNY